MIEKFEVTQELIDKGQPGAGDTCPIALAIKHRRSGAGLISCWYGSTGMFNYSGGVRHFVYKYDKHLKVSPFTLVLDSINMRAYMEGEAC